MSLADAYKLVHNKRIFVRPNMGFWKQLIEYEEELIGRNTVTMILSGSSMLIPFFICPLVASKALVPTTYVLCAVLHSENLCDHL